MPGVSDTSGLNQTDCGFEGLSAGLGPEFDQALAFIAALLPIARLMRVSNQKTPGITPRMLFAAVIVASNGPLSVGELADKLRSNLASVSFMVAQLEALHLVKREPDQLDHRRILVVPGPGLKECLAEVVAPRLAPLSKALEVMGDEKREQLFGLLRELAMLVTKQLDLSS